MQLTYHGIFKRPDGKKVALIEDSKTQRKSFYHLGAKVYGTRVSEIDLGSITLKLADNTTTTLDLGESGAFVEGLRDN